MDSWRQLAKRASRQQGLVTLHQAVALGLPARTVQDHARRLGWTRIHRGVYALPGSLPTFDQQVMAALLACGPRSAASHPRLRLTRESVGSHELCCAAGRVRLHRIGGVAA
ncbi:MAG: hypothetical protein GEU81_01410 [Nitriliruptorales bacterium]|nr:hypothetical protein [Nitriliruptorales bacterium]